MDIFINDLPVRIIPKEDLSQEKVFQHSINAKKEDIIPINLINNVLIKKANSDNLKEIFDLIIQNPFNDLNSLTILTDQYDDCKKFIKKDYFKVIKAAGGLVRKKNRYLMIYRYMKWDLPKGKVEKGEDYKAAAVREVEEECNIKVKLRKKICATWHTYTLNGKNILKKTNWYEMGIIDDSNMKPRTKEGIEDVKWMNHKELYNALNDSYRSLSYVFDKYFKMKGII